MSKQTKALAAILVLLLCGSPALAFHPIKTAKRLTAAMKLETKIYWPILKSDVQVMFAIPVLWMMGVHAEMKI